MAARFYAPGLGTFTSMDSVLGSAQDPASLNRFLYAEANPATLVDPTGHCSRWMDGVCADVRSTAASVAWHRREALQRAQQREADFEQHHGRSTRAKAGTGAPLYPLAVHPQPAPPCPGCDRIKSWVDEKSGVRLTADPAQDPHGFAQFVSTLLQMPPFVGDLYQAWIINNRRDPISGDTYSYEEAQNWAVLAVGSASLIPVVKFGAPGDEAAGALYRTGSQTDHTLTAASGVSFRDSISSSADRVQVFEPGDKIWAVDPAKLPDGSVTKDGAPFGPMPAGHVTVVATPASIRAATIQDQFLASTLKLLEDGTYRLPK